MKKCFLNLTVTSVIVTVVLCRNQDGPQYKPCWVSGVVNGTCLPVDDCPAAWRLLRMKLIEELRRQSCGFLGVHPLVCCENETINSNDQIKFNDNATFYTTLAPTATTIKDSITTPINLPQNTSFNIPNPSFNTQNPSLNTQTPSFNFQNTSFNIQNTKLENQGTLNEVLLDNIFHENDTSFRIPQLDPSHQVAMAAAAPKSVLPERRICGRNADVAVRITGGVPTEITEFPWVVRIKYRSANGTELYGCSGTLISENYVLTAAHCVTRLAVTEVRLGEWDEETDIDCAQETCNDKPRDIKVLSLIVYPKYQRSNLSHDIALIRLEQPVNYTDYIRPICLPTTEYIAKQDYIPDEMSYVTAGWGKTEFGPKSTILRKVNLKAVSMPICRTPHTQIGDDDVANLICAGGRKGEDSCDGDSGGGLFKQVKEDNNINWFLYGITSYGSRRCGGEAIPSVYTRVTAYMKWILNNIRP